MSNKAKTNIDSDKNYRNKDVSNVTNKISSDDNSDNIVEKDDLGLYNDVTNAANNFISTVRGKKPNSTQRLLTRNYDNKNNDDKNNDDKNDDDKNDDDKNDDKSTNENKPYVGDLNDSNSQNALKRNLDPDDVKLTMSIGDVTKETREQLFSSASDLLVTQSALVIDKLIDLATYATLGYHTMSKVTKEDLIDDLTKKRDVMVGVMKDPKGRKVIRDIAYVSAKILAVIIKAVEKPAIEARDRLMNIVVSSSDKILAKGFILMKNLVKIVPGIGDFYIIADNGLQMTKAATEMAKSSTKAANVTTKSFATMAENVGKIQKPLNSDFTFLEKSMEDFNELREKIRKSTQMPNIDESTQHLKRTIHDIGKKASAQMNNVRNSMIHNKSKATPMVGGKTLKKYKRNMKSRRKIYRKNSLKNKNSLKSCIKTPACNFRDVIRKTKKKCVKFDV